jgi:hypothetical protein
MKLGCWWMRAEAPAFPLVYGHGLPLERPKEPLHRCLRGLRPIYTLLLVPLSTRLAGWQYRPTSP